MANLTQEEYQLLNRRPLHSDVNWASGTGDRTVIASDASKHYAVTMLTISTNTAGTFQVKDGTTVLATVYLAANSTVTIGNGKGVIYVSTQGNSVRVNNADAGAGGAHCTYHEVL